MPIKIAIVDDHQLIAVGICHVLEPYSDIEVTGTYNSGRSVLEGLTIEQPDVLLLDIVLPDISGNDLVRIISARYPKLRILAHTSIDTPFHVKDMMTHGCSGFLSKGAAPDLLVEAIRQVYSGRTYIENGLKENIVSSVFRPKKATELTRREQEILELICSGLTNNEIADKLFVNIRTVENHRFSLYHKLGVKNTAELVKFALQTGLIK